MGRPHPATIALGAMTVAAGVLLLYAGRHLTFFYDEWTFILERRGSSLATYLDPHNGHLSLVPVAIYKALFATVGLRHYIAYRAVITAMHLVNVALLYVLAARRLGRWLALLPTALLLFLGSAYQDLLWPFQIGFLGAVTAGLGALCLLDRPAGAQTEPGVGRGSGEPKPSAWRDALAASLLAVSLACSGVGIPFVLAAAVLLVAGRSRWTRLWVIGAPVILFAGWYAGWGTSEHVTGSALRHAPSYVAKAAAAAVGGIAGVNPFTYGTGLTIAALIALALVLARRRGRVLTPLMLGSAVGVLSFWVLTAVSRADFAEPTASRYVYIGAVFILLICVEATAGIRVPRLALVGACVLVAVALGLNVRHLRGGERSLRSVDEPVRAALGAVQVAAPVVAPNFEPYPSGAPQITAGPYLAAVRELGSPAYSLTELSAVPESRRLVADRVLIGAERLGLHAGPPCRAPAGQATSLTLAPGTRVVLQGMAPGRARLLVRRFADEYNPVTGDFKRGQSAILVLPRDLAADRSWRVRYPGPARYRPCV